MEIQIQACAVFFVTFGKDQSGESAKKRPSHLLKRSLFDHCGPPSPAKMLPDLTGLMQRSILPESNTGRPHLQDMQRKG